MNDEVNKIYNDLVKEMKLPERRYKEPFIVTLCGYSGSGKSMISKILSSELSTHLSGRYISIKILPFTFSGYLELNDDKKSVDDKFLNYIDWGGMPQIYNTDSMQERKMYLRDLYNTVVLKDIIEKNNIKDINLLNRIIQFIMGNIGGVISANSITNFF